jgi:cell division protein FtsQ
VDAKTTIRKIVFIAVWLCIGGGMFILLMAAINKKNKGLCEGYTITLKGVRNNFFIDEKDVEQMLMKGTKGNIKGEAIASFNLHVLEQLLEKNTWIDEAELYFDNRDVLHVSVTEKEPVARIFTTTGNSFYIDSLGRRMPLSDKLSARVPVFTGFPEKKKLTAADSVLLNEVRMTANYINGNSFWMSQVAQIDITPEKNFEMVPVVGNHLVKLGSGEATEKKFNRLLVFYKQVLSKTGFDKYKVIDVQYKGQVVASKFAGNAKVDSVQLRKNVEKLLRQSVEAENDTVVRKLQPIVKLETDSVSKADPDLKDKTQVNPEHHNPNTMKLSVPLKPTADKGKENRPKPKLVKPVPKAVMPKKPAAEDNGGYN